MTSERLGEVVDAPALRFVTVPGATLRTAQVGSGPPLLLINGIGASIEMWQPLAQRLARTHRVIMFDAPGAGRSAAPARPLSMPRLGRVVVDLLDALGYGEVDVVGYSWGGALAQQLAHHAPHRIRRLVLASTSPGLGGQPPSPLVSSVMLAPLRYISPGFLAWTAPHIYGGGARTPSPGAHLDAWLAHPPGYRGYAYQAFAIGTWSSLPWLHRICAPTLVVQGDDDPLVPLLNARLLARRIPHSTLEIVPGAGHLWLLEEPEAAARTIDDFLE